MKPICLLTLKNHHKKTIVSYACDMVDLNFPAAKFESCCKIWRHAFIWTFRQAIDKSDKNQFSVSSISQESPVISKYNIKQVYIQCDAGKYLGNIWTHENTLHLALIGEMWAVCSEYFGENGPCYNGTVLYYKSVISIQKVCLKYIINGVVISWEGIN